jgi:hypothetical protein
MSERTRYRPVGACLVGVKTLIKDDTMNAILTILQVVVLLTVMFVYGRD